MSLTSQQVQTIKATVPVLKEHGNTITISFYKTLLSEIPALNNVFNQANQANNNQASALAGALFAYASHIDDLGALTPAVEMICQKHASLYIQAEHYKVVGEYLLRAMGDVLGDALTPEIHDAWAAAYWQLANLMVNREDTLMKERQGWTDWRDFKISDKVKESEDVTSFYFKPLDGKKLPNFLPGQYISVMMDVPKANLIQSRQYSLSDAPSPDYYRISVRKQDGVDHTHPDAVAQPGWMSNLLHSEKQPGDIVKISHPSGEFFLDTRPDDSAPVVLLSAGIGLTPMIAILNTLIKQNPKKRISFIHGARNSAVRSFFPHVQKLASQNPNITYSTFVNNPAPNEQPLSDNYTQFGRLDLGKLDRTVDLCLDQAETQYFVCGPKTFMADISAGLVERGVANERIKMEVFGVGDVAKL